MEAIVRTNSNSNLNPARLAMSNRPGDDVRLRGVKPGELVATIKSLSHTFAIVRDDGSDELLWNCQLKTSSAFNTIEMRGQSVVEQCRGLLRASNMVITCNPQQGYTWQLHYLNHITGATLDPSTYLKLSLDRPQDITLPVLRLSSLQSLIESPTTCHLPLLEFDFLSLSKLTHNFSRTLQFAMRQRLRRYLIAVNPGRFLQ